VHRNNGPAITGTIKGTIKGTVKGTTKGTIKGTMKGTIKGTIKGNDVLTFLVSFGWASRSDAFFSFRPKEEEHARNESSPLR
jgi:hypothetical protein